jgi:putative ABC transport system permease protein
MLMSPFRFIVQSLRHYLKSDLLVMAGVALSTAILTGALFIGDSMRFSLEKITLSRLGTTTTVITAGDRFSRAGLAGDISRLSGQEIIPVLLLQGSAVSEGGLHRANQVQIIGVGPGFEKISGTGIYGDIPDDEIIINESLAFQLKVRAGDFLLLRMAKASLMPLNTPFVSDAKAVVTARVKIRVIASREQTGDLNLKNSQSSPYNIFISLDRLNRLMDLENRANRLLVCGNISTGNLYAYLNASLQPADAGILFKTLPVTGETEITSERIFLDTLTTRVFCSVPGSRPVLTYFVNSIRFGDKSVPYSFVSSWPGLPVSPGEVILNSWAAEDLGIHQGDSVKMTYFEIGPLRQLISNSISLKVSRVVPMEGEFGDRSLMPLIPGLSDAGHCREWETGVPVDLNSIRKKDEEYWNRFRGTPKAFVSYELAGRLWSNRFGNSTAIRIPAGKLPDSEFNRFFSGKFNASQLGYAITPVRDQGLTAARNGTDFGGLFLGLSFFLLLSALLLTSLLFNLNLRTRESQTGTLLQLGFTGKQIFGIYLIEGLLISVPGVLAGLLLAVVYVRIIFVFLNSLWWDIVRTSVIYLEVRPLTAFLGALITLAVIGMAIAIPLRKFLSSTIHTLQQKQEKSLSLKWVKLLKYSSIFLISLALVLVLFQLIAGDQPDPALFFLSGGILLTGGLLYFGAWLGNPLHPQAIRPASVFPGRKQYTRNRRRSLSVFLLISLGSFIVISTGANRQDLLAGSQQKSSGTGGFGYFAESSVPVLYDLNDREKRVKEELDTSFRIVQMQKVSGDDASCLNLNQVQNPSVLGVNVGDLKGCFSFATGTAELDRTDPWNSLKKILPGGVIPAIADQSVIQWGLGKKTGDTLTYLNDSGDTLHLRLIGGLASSVLQGYVVIDQAVFLRNYPSKSGSSVFLLDSFNEADAGAFADLFRDNGMEVMPASRKLAGFYAVTNTYLSIFLALGALALVIGTIGVSLILARTLQERKQEIAIMLAVGHTRRSVAGGLIREYGLLLFAGLAMGTLSALVALLPGLLSGNHTVSVVYIAALFLLILLNGLGWITLLTRRIIRSNEILSSLRGE